MKANMKKITAAVLGVVMISGVCAANANAAVVAHNQRHVVQKRNHNHRPAMVRYNHNQRPVIVQQSGYNTGINTNAGVLETVKRSVKFN